MRYNRIITARQVLEGISDERSQELLNFIAAGENCSDMVGESKMTRKQYYLRVSRFTTLGLIKRVEGRYALTTFGSVVYEAQLRLAVAVNNRWKLKAFDTLYSDNTIPVSERSQLMNQIISDTGKNEIILESFISKDDKAPLIQV